MSKNYSDVSHYFSGRNCTQLVMGSTGNSSTAHGGWYHDHIFGPYRFYSTDDRGNHIYTIESGELYFIRKHQNGNWLVRFKLHCIWNKKTERINSTVEIW